MLSWDPTHLPSFSIRADIHRLSCKKVLPWEKTTPPWWPIGACLSPWIWAVCRAEMLIPVVWDGSSVAKGTKVPACVSCSRQCSPLLRCVLGQLVTWMCLTSLSTVPTLGPGDKPRRDRTFGALRTCTGPAAGVSAQLLSWES